MSEIFNWLKRTEFEGKRESIEGAAVHVDMEPERGQEDWIDSEEMTEKLRPAHSTAPRRVNAVRESFMDFPGRFAAQKEVTFDLDLADDCVKSALDPTSLVGEQFRLLRAGLSLLQKQKGIKTLIVTSATPGEGKTFFSCSIASILAQESGKRILLVDGDLRRPKAGQCLGLTKLDAPGLCEVLHNGTPVEKVLIGTTGSGLYLLPAGRVPINPSELLSSSRLESMLNSLVPLFDWIIIDSPPVLSLADTNVMVPLCDAALIVARANRTPAKLIKEAIQKVGKEKVYGVVLNYVHRLKTSQYYYHYYKTPQST